MPNTLLHSLTYYYIIQAIPWHIDMYSDNDFDLKVGDLVALTSNKVLGNYQISLRRQKTIYSIIILNKALKIRHTVLIIMFGVMF